MHAAHSASISHHAGVLHFMAACMRVTALARTPARSSHGVLHRPRMPHHNLLSKVLSLQKCMLQLMHFVHARCSAAAAALTAPLCVGTSTQTWLILNGAHTALNNAYMPIIARKIAVHKSSLLRSTGPCKRCTKKWRSRLLRWPEEGIVTHRP